MIGAVIGDAPRGGGLHRAGDRADPDLRRPGGDRGRERPAVQGAASADGRADAIGGAAHGAGRGRPGGQLDARPRHGARHDRHPRESARRGPTDARSSSTTRPRRYSGFARAATRTPGRRPRWTRSRAPRRFPRGKEWRAGRPCVVKPSTSPTSPSKAPTRARCERRSSRRAIARSWPCPLLREEQVIGVLAVIRKTPGEFAPEVVRAAHDVRHPVGPGDPERPALPRDREQEPAARGREPPQVRVPGQHVPRAADAR